MSAEMITYEIEGDIAVIGLNRPDKRNAMNDTVISLLRDAVVRAGEEADCGVIFGHGPNFSAGLDLSELASRLAPDVKRPRKRKPHTWHTCFDAIARGTIPFVAALHGATIGGGLELAAATHIRVADETTFFGLPEGQRGIFVGGGGSVRISRLIGASRMMEMMLTGRTYGAEDGLRFALSHYVVGPGEGLAKGLELAKRVAQNAALTNFAVIQALPRIAEAEPATGLLLEAMMSSIAQADPAAKERLRDFLEKRAAKVSHT
jgi:enoyl-CoA hydratase/carnithine racemase